MVNVLCRICALQKLLSLPTPSKVTWKFLGKREGFEKPTLLKGPLSSGWEEFGEEGARVFFFCLCSNISICTCLPSNSCGSLSLGISCSPKRLLLFLQQSTMTFVLFYFILLIVID